MIETLLHAALGATFAIVLAVVWGVAGQATYTLISTL